MSTGIRACSVGWSKGGVLWAEVGKFQAPAWEGVYDRDSGDFKIDYSRCPASLIAAPSGAI